MSKRQRRTHQKRQRHAVLSRGRVAAGGGLALAASLVSGSVAEAGTTFTVSTNADAGTGSLRAEITAANASSGNTIAFQSNVTGSISLASALPAITQPMTISGRGAQALSVDGNNSFQIFNIVAGPTQISGLTLKRGKAGNGGAIGSTGGTALTLTNDAFQGNYTTGGVGSNGGAVNSNGGSLTVSGTTFSGNTSGGKSGALYQGFGPLTITDSTISGNTASGHGAAFLAYQSAVTVTDSTIAGNTDLGTGEQIAMGMASSLTLHDSIVAGSAASASADIQGATVATTATVSGDFSLIRNVANGPTITALTAGSNITGIDPQLGTLQNNGGPTDTRLPLAGSPVIDKGKAFSISLDQRGLARTYDNPAIANSAAAGADGTDMGAAEVQPAPIVPSVASVAPSSGPAGTSVVISGSGFTGATQVLFGSTAAVFLVNGDGQITAAAPTGPNGAVDVRVVTPGGETAVTASDRFTYTGGGGGAGGGGGPGGGGGGAGGGTPILRPAVNIGGSPSTNARGSGVIVDTGITVSCPVGGSSCSVATDGKSTVPAALAAARHKKKKNKTINDGHSQITIAAGHSARIKLVLSARAVRALRRQHHLTITLTVVSRDGAGPAVTTHKRIRIKPPHKAKKRRHRKRRHR